MPRPMIRALNRLHLRLAARKAWTVDRGPWTEGTTDPSGFRSTLSGARPTAHGPRLTSRGFTLIELMVVMAIIGILATIAVPAMKTAPIRAREAALKEDLYQLRSVIDQFHADRDRYPASLDELVSMGYLRQVPIDPVTRAADWVTETPEVTGDETERESEEAGGGQGIIDVHSASDQAALDGTRYSDW
jgi:general secretion pathway protein G